MGSFEKRKKYFLYRNKKLTKMKNLDALVVTVHDCLVYFGNWPQDIFTYEHHLL